MPMYGGRTAPVQGARVVERGVRCPWNGLTQETAPEGVADQV